MNALGVRSVMGFVAVAVIAARPSPAAGQAVAVPPNLILPNYDRIPVGQREGIEAGAYVARSDDAAANWYNPAGLAKSAKTSLNASATAYEWTSVTLEGFGTSAGRSRISSIGTLLAVAIGEGTIRSDQWRLGFSITRPIVWQPSTIDLAFPLQAGERVSYSTDVQFDVMVPGVAVAFAPGGVSSGKFRIGAGLGLAITTLTQEQVISDRVTTASSASVALRGFGADGSVWHLQPSGGVQWDPTPRVTLGARVVAPSLRVHGSSTLRLENSRFTVADLSDLVFRDSTVEFDYRSPFQAAAGAAVRFGGGGAIELDVRYYGAVDPYAMYASTVPGRLTTQTGSGAPVVTTPPFTTTMNSARSVVNVGIGGHHPLSKKFGVHAGFSTDQSPVDDQAQSIFRKVDLSRITAGVSLTSTSLSGSLGFGYSFGSGTRQTLGSTESGQPTETQLRVRTVNVLFALSYAFHSP